MMNSEYSVAILCGGQSRRMGEDKALMNWHGQPMLLHLLEGFQGCRDIIISAHKGQNLERVLNTGSRMFQDGRIRIVQDQVEEYGPMEGLHESLRAAESDIVFVTTCDAPDVSRVLADYLVSQLVSCDAAVPVTEDGRVHALVAAYRKRILPEVEKQIGEDLHRIRGLLDQIQTRYVPAGTLPGGEEVLINLNTPQEKQAAW